MNTTREVFASRVPAALFAGLVEADAIDRLINQSSFSSITLDSRSVTPGGLFMAMPGSGLDGRAWADDAVAAGAATVVFEASDAPAACDILAARGLAAAVTDLRSASSLIAARYFGHPSKRLRVIGVTGTNGKTTCAWLLAQALEKLGQRSAMMGTIGSGPIAALVESSLTTADAVAVQRTLAELAEGGIDAVCMEVSSHGLDQKRVDAVDFDVALFTNISQDHLDYHRDMAAYGQAKRRLFELPGLGAMVVNADDAFGRALCDDTDRNTETPALISYGFTAGSLRGADACCDNTGTQLTVNWKGRTARLKSSLIGEINLPNLVGVTGCLLALGYSLSQIARVMPFLSPPPGRMELFRGKGDQPAVVVDYSHTPDALDRALDSLRHHVTGRLWVVFGCGGDRDRGKRRIMGQVAARRADQIVVTNDNPRSESPEAIADEIEGGIRSVSGSVVWRRQLDRLDAIRLAIAAATSDDVVLVAGKGHERTQTIGDQVLPFSDREAVRTLLGDQT